MELKHLRAFQAVVDQGSCQKAAELLGYTQSTITVQLQRLEESLGAPLFERNGRRLALTETGRAVLPQARELLAAADRLAETGRQGRTLRGTLRVDMAETLLCWRAQPVIEAFRARAPEVRLTIRSRNCIQIPENVRRGDCDLGVGYDMEWSRDALEVEALAECGIALLAPPGFPEPDFVTPGAEKDRLLITDEPDNIFRRCLEAYLRERDITLGVTLELWSIETIKRCAVRGLGFTFLPRFVAQDELAAGTLVELEAPVRSRFPFLCAHRKGRWVTPAMALFLDLLRKELADLP